MPRGLRGGAAAGLVLGLALLGGCSGSDPAPPDARPAPTAASGAPATPVPATPVPATPVPAPPEGACYRLSYDEAVAPTTEAEPVRCRSRHTSETFAVGRIDAVVDGHLLAVDSEHVQDQVARTCPQRLAGFLGGSPEQLRLSMLRSVWFTPSVEASDAGADWFRCDAIAVAADGRLAPLEGPLAGLLADPERRAAYGMCGTAEPGTAPFRRVICSAEHAWRAVATVPFEPGGWPGADVVRGRGEAPCQDAGRAAADDPLDFRWGYEWPTREQWRAGQTWGLCWVPD